MYVADARTSSRLARFIVGTPAMKGKCAVKLQDSNTKESNSAGIKKGRHLCINRKAGITAVFFMFRVSAARVAMFRKHGKCK